MAYDVSTPVYEGPFDMLLHLILREQVELYDISLQTIIDAYLGELDIAISSSPVGEPTTESVVDLDVATEFLLIAATLIELKTRRLLPSVDDGDLDDELAIWEERDLLLARLLECKTFKDAAAAMRGIADDAALSFARVAGPEERYHELAPDILVGVVPNDLRRAFLAAIAPKPIAQVDTDHIAPITSSVTDAVAQLIEELPLLGRVSFRDLTGSIVERLELVVRFLAVLELFKTGHVELEQLTNFGEIVIQWVGDGEDRPLEFAVDTYEG